MATDRFDSSADTLFAPARAPYPLVPHDSNEVPVIPKRLFIGTGGTVTLRGVGANSDVTYKNVASGVYLNVRPQYVRATGTTATDIIAEG